MKITTRRWITISSERVIRIVICPFQTEAGTELDRTSRSRPYVAGSGLVTRTAPQFSLQRLQTTAQHRSTFTQTAGPCTGWTWLASRYKRRTRTGGSAGLVVARSNPAGDDYLRPERRVSRNTIAVPTLNRTNMTIHRRREPGGIVVSRASHSTAAQSGSSRNIAAMGACHPGSPYRPVYTSASFGWSPTYTAKAQSAMYRTADTMPVARAARTSRSLDISIGPP